MSQSTTQAVRAEQEAHTAGAPPLALRLSAFLRRFVDRVGRFGSWLVVPMILFTVLDVVQRKISWLDDEGKLHGLQVFLTGTFGRIFESTMLQELEWHFHAATFALVLGYGYIHNTHVRVDLIRENLSFRKQAWTELFGITFFLIPYIICIVYFAWGYAVTSYNMNEISASTVGLSHRWIIKSVLVVGLIVAGLAGIAVWLEVAVALFGDPARRFQLSTLEWPEERGSKIEGKERVKLDDDAMDTLAAPDEETKKRTSDILASG